MHVHVFAGRDLFLQAVLERHQHQHTTTVENSNLEAAANQCDHKALSLPGIFIGTVIELGVKRAVAQRRTLIVGWELPEALRLDIAS